MYLDGTHVYAVMIPYIFFSTLYFFLLPFSKMAVMLHEQQKIIVVLSVPI